MKKSVSVFFILLTMIILLGCFSLPKKAKNVFAKYNFTSQIESESALLLDANSCKILYSKNQDKKLPIASMCKIMTLLVAFDNIQKNNISYSEEIIASENASKMGGSQVFLESGGKYSIGDLIKSITIASANDACVAIAERICGSEESFVSKMNEKAKEIGAFDTNFTNCTGLPKEGQYSTVKDVAVMFCNLIKHKEYFNYSTIWMDKISHKNNRITEISNTNKLIKFYNGCDGGKTGFTQEAGHCLCATAIKDNTRLISVVIKAPNSKQRFKEVSSLFDYGFANFATKEIVVKNKPISVDFIFKNSKNNNALIAADQSVYDCIKKNENKAYNFSFKKHDNVKPPLHAGDKIGDLEIYSDGVLIKKVNLILLEDVLEKTFIDSIADVINNWNIYK